MAFYSPEKLKEMGFGSLGKNVFVSDKASLYNIPNIFLGDDVRIDDFCIISAGAGGIYLQDHVHIACYVSLIGAGKIFIDSFAGISARTSIYSSNDDYSGASLTGPTVPNEYRNVAIADVHIGRHVIVGAGSIILPGVSVGNGVAVGAMSLINKNLEENFIYIGAPAKKLRARNNTYLALEKKFLNAKK